MGQERPYSFGAGPPSVFQGQNGPHARQGPGQSVLPGLPCAAREGQLAVVPSTRDMSPAALGPSPHPPEPTAGHQCQSVAQHASNAPHHGQNTTQYGFAQHSQGMPWHSQSMPQQSQSMPEQSQSMPQHGQSMPEQGQSLLQNDHSKTQPGQEAAQLRQDMSQPTAMQTQVQYAESANTQPLLLGSGPKVQPVAARLWHSLASQAMHCIPMLQHLDSVCCDWSVMLRYCHVGKVLQTWNCLTAGSELAIG